MPWSAVFDFLAALAVKVLKEWLARLDLRRRTQLEIYHELDQLAAEALAWKIRALRDPALGARLRVLDPERRIISPSEHPGA